MNYIFSIKAHFLIWSYEACNNNDKLVIENLVLGAKCIGPKYFRAEVGIGPKYYWGQSIPHVEMCLGLKYAWGQSGLGAKVAESHAKRVPEFHLLSSLRSRRR